jgi:cytochrome c oxidase subunit 1
MPRRYYDYANYAFIPASAHTLNVFITVVALIVGAMQMVFVFNLVWSTFRGARADANPWRAASLEWFTPRTPPEHGNWGKKLPTVHRWAYAYSVPGARADFIPQNAPLEAGGLEPQPHAAKGGAS